MALAIRAVFTTLILWDEALLNVVDGTPISFANFIDTYGMKLGYSKPAYIPSFTASVAIIIKKPQMEILDSTTVNCDRLLKSSLIKVLAITATKKF